MGIKTFTLGPRPAHCVRFLKTASLHIPSGMFPRTSAMLVMAESSSSSGSERRYPRLAKTDRLKVEGEWRFQSEVADSVNINLSGTQTESGNHFTFRKDLLHAMSPPRVYSAYCRAPPAPACEGMVSHRFTKYVFTLLACILLLYSELTGGASPWAANCSSSKYSCTTSPSYQPVYSSPTPDSKKKKKSCTNVSSGLECICLIQVSSLASSRVLGSHESALSHTIYVILLYPVSERWESNYYQKQKNRKCHPVMFPRWRDDSLLSLLRSRLITPPVIIFAPVTMINLRLVGRLLWIISGHYVTTFTMERF